MEGCDRTELLLPRVLVRHDRQARERPGEEVPALADAGGLECLRPLLVEEPLAAADLCPVPYVSVARI
ncbi:hypothetical protein GCM10017771_46350 [Streptomyces capitiformicae]|uniref:Uncharacterized protein n=1 Tax=Streptomyces capitiformicae TaxID=2014920 RepID=A0A919DBL2_9ACTN|nr:hypothetical protein GCM10017771_46350 [Streptomyces capitiformicae]